MSSLCNKRISNTSANDIKCESKQLQVSHLIRLIWMLLSIFLLILISSCNGGSLLNQSLNSAGNNRPELEKVLDHYKDDAEKLLAAKFLIENMLAHYSYKDHDAIIRYYEFAESVLASDMTPEKQRDTLLFVTDSFYRDLPKQTVPDAQIITSEFLIHTIDLAYNQWKTCPWAVQVTFDDFLEYLLPYKATELQELDYWRDSLYYHFSDGLNNLIPNDVEYNTTMGIADMIRNEVLNKINRHGLYTRSGLPLLNSYLLPRQTFGNIPDYVLLSVLTFRSTGIPVVQDETPVGSRYEAAAKWFVIMGDNGEKSWSEWDLSTTIGSGFFPYERGPKVFRNTYAINPDRFEYMRKTKYLFPFELGKKDITDQYFRTSDISVPINKSQRKTLKDKYVYIASAIRQKDLKTDSVIAGTHDWAIVDFGSMKHGNAQFKKMGREVLYQVLGYDGKELKEIAEPFILHKDGMIEYILSDTVSSKNLDKWRNNPL